MKKGIHPDYGYVIYRCPATGTNILTRSTRLDGKKLDHEGHQVPSVTVEICSDNHPFYTGKQGLVDTTGRVEAFNKRFSRHRRKD
jgi:large subunit ribosomal protein L31